MEAKGQEAMDDGSALNKPSRLRQVFCIGLRLFSLTLSLVGLIVMAKNKELALLSQSDDEDPPVYMPAKFSFVRAFVYLVFANGLVVVYGFLLSVALLVGLFARASMGKPLLWVLFIFDQTLTYILLAAASSSAEMAYLMKEGNEKVTWGPVCYYFDHFCSYVVVSLVVTFLSILGMAILSVMSAQSLFRKYTCTR